MAARYGRPPLLDLDDFRRMRFERLRQGIGAGLGQIQSGLGAIDQRQLDDAARARAEEDRQRKIAQEKAIEQRALAEAARAAEKEKRDAARFTSEQTDAARAREMEIAKNAAIARAAGLGPQEALEKARQFADIQRSGTLAPVPDELMPQGPRSRPGPSLPARPAPNPRAEFIRQMREKAGVKTLTDEDLAGVLSGAMTVRENEARKRKLEEEARRLEAEEKAREEARADRALDLREKNERGQRALGWSRLKAEQEEAKARADKKDAGSPLQRGEVQDIVQIDAALKSLDQVLVAKREGDDGKPIDTGPLAAGWSWVTQKAGMSDEKVDEFKAKVGAQLADYIKSISGATVSDDERARLLENVPTMSDNDKAFEAKLKAVRERLMTLRGTTMQILGAAGRDLSKVPEAPAPTPDKVLITKDGQFKRIPRDVLPRAARDGWTEVKP